MALLVENERIELFATMLDNVAAASATIGVIAPLSKVLFEGESATLEVHSGVYVLFWLTACLLVHAIARYALGGLRE